MARTAKLYHFPKAQMNGIHLATIGDRPIDALSRETQRKNDDTVFNNPTVVRLLLADDDDVDQERIVRLLARSRFSCEILIAKSGAQTLDLLHRESLDCLILDYYLGDMTGIDVLNRIAQDYNISIPVIMITGAGDEELVVNAMRLGVYDYLPKNKLTREKICDAIESSLKHAMLQRRLIEMQKKLEHMSLYDELTGLPNRNLFFDRLEHAISNADRDGSQFALLMMDLNLFKQVNDHFGHAAGDYVLAEMGKRFREVARKSDTISRLGGDEFTCILNGVMTESCAITFAEKLVDIIGKPVPIAGTMVQVGASIGICLYPSHGTEASMLLSNADHAMYQAKKSLRNYVVYGETIKPHGVKTVISGRFQEVTCVRRWNATNFTWYTSLK